MAKFQFTSPNGGPMDYPALGFSAVDGAILNGDLPTAGTFATIPDANWEVYGGGSAETGINRYADPAVELDFSEPEDGDFLTYSRTQNEGVFVSPVDAFTSVADPVVAAAIEDEGSATQVALSNAIETAAGKTLTPEQFGAVGDGTTDDTDAVRDCFDAANALNRAGLTASIKHPGATVVLTGVYSLASLATPIDIRCNVAFNRATFLIPAAYADIAVRVGHTTSGSYLQAADIYLPDIVKPTGTAVVAGSIGCRTMNIGDSFIRFGRTAYFETGINFSGDGQGTAYNTIAIGWISYCKVSLSLKPHVASGWCNQNTFIGGSIQQSVTYAGGSIRASGWRHVVLDGTAGNYVNGNVFLGTSFEGDASEFWAEFKAAADNHFIGTRHEQGTASIAVTVSGDTLTKTAHGLGVGDMVTFSASVAPTGMVVAAPYFVVNLPDANTFKVSKKKGGTAITFSSSGTSVVYFRPPRVKFDQSSGILQNNTIDRPYLQQGIMEVVNTTAGGSNNLAQRPGFSLLDTFAPEDIPLYRARNRSAASITRAVFAAYASGVDPKEDPMGWGAALSDVGLLWATSGAETGRLLNSSTGVLQYKKPADAVTYELPSYRRTQTGTTLASGTTYAAGTRATGTVTLTGVAQGDYVAWSNVSGTLVPRGLTISAQVTAADTITYAIDNNTGADITTAANIVLYFKAARRFF